MRYFRLEPDVTLQLGACAGALYALGRRSVLDLSPDEARIVRDCERGLPLEQISDGESDVNALVNRLKRAHLGRYLERPIVVDRYVHATNARVKGYYEPPLALDAVYLQLASRCDLSCTDCDTQEFATWQGCHSCQPWPGVLPGASWTREALDDVVDQLAPLQIGHVYVAGGNPLLEEDLLRHVVERVSRWKRPAAVIVTTNGLGLSEELARWMTARGGAFNFVRLAPDRSVSERVSQSSIAYDAVESAIDCCRTASAKFYLTLRLSEQIRITGERWRAKVSSLGAERVLLTERVRPVSRSDSHVWPLKALRTTERTRVPQVGPKEMFARRHVNHCLDRGIAVAADRQVRACSMLEERLGDLAAEPLQRVFADRRVDRYWQMTKDSIAGCRQCEFRYACVDCTALDLWRTALPKAGLLTCGYDPEHGAWANGEASSPRANAASTESKGR
jgi:radical SAM protein with 4Fe4S-binding SPASM domain